MTRTLIVAEKFNTALRIAIVLSDGRMKRSRIAGTNVFEFERPDGPTAVVGLRGHIVELDYPDEHRQWTMAGLPALLETPPHKRVTEGGIVQALQSIVRQYDRVVIATDFDREGELIGLECLELLLKVHPGLEVKRARYSALTRDEIEQSFLHLQEVDRALAEAGEARQEIDLVWGALLTRYLSLTAGQRGRGSKAEGLAGDGATRGPRCNPRGRGVLQPPREGAVRLLLQEAGEGRVNRRRLLYAGRVGRPVRRPSIRPGRWKVRQKLLSSGAP